jgi:hypothetical protein
VEKAGMFLCNPHNPVGHIYSREEPMRMAEICIENKVSRSDEIHAELLLGGAKFTPSFFFARDRKHTVTLISASARLRPRAFLCVCNYSKPKTLETISICARMSFEISTPG